MVSFQPSIVKKNRSESDPNNIVAHVVVVLLWFGHGHSFELERYLLVVIV